MSEVLYLIHISSITIIPVPVIRYNGSRLYHISFSQLCCVVHLCTRHESITFLPIIIKLQLKGSMQEAGKSAFLVFAPAIILCMVDAQRSFDLPSDDQYQKCE